MEVITSEDISSFFEEKWLELRSYYVKSVNPLSNAIVYALEGQGKRVRPLLVFLCNQLGGGRIADAVSAALAVEMIHCYSLIHDDLPLMDDDSMRRGRLTLHKKFDEPTALLAGNALLTDAFLLLSNPSLFISSCDECLTVESRLALNKALAFSAGSKGILYGQMMDMYWTNRQDPSKKDLDNIHYHKTGSLLASACVLGGVVANVGLEQQNYFRQFGRLIGLVFQIVDDVIDDQKSTGKSKGKDRSQCKLSYMRLLGKDKSMALAKENTALALNLLNSFPSSLAKNQLMSFVSRLIYRTT